MSTGSVISVFLLNWKTKNGSIFVLFSISVLNWKTNERIDTRIIVMQVTVISLIW